LTLRLVAWEATAACNLACAHCRASAGEGPEAGELETHEVKVLIDDLAGMQRGTLAPLVFIISGGEPLLRPDVFEVAAYAAGAGLRPVLGTNGTLLSQVAVRRLAQAGVRGVSVSLDGHDAPSHDTFRAVDGAFDAAVRGLQEARREGLPVRVSTTVTRRNMDLLPDILSLAAGLGAATWDLFMLVPTGRGVSEAPLTAEEYEKVLTWVADISAQAPVPVKVTCGPHYARVWRQRRPDRRPGAHPPGGCLAGSGFCFVSRTGEVTPCGYLPVAAGNVRDRPFSEIYARSEVLLSLRDPARLGGKCGRCEFRAVCRGCRARALAASGDYLAEEPLCRWEPRGAGDAREAASGGCGGEGFL
jgi:radical SAM protein with 4Fe4S-binding SPASM domain